MSIRINGLVQSTHDLNQHIHDYFSQSVNNSPLQAGDPFFTRTHDQIAKTCHQVERICQKKGATPADLPNPSFRAYQWLHFLEQKRWLLAHLQAYQQFLGIMSDVKSHLFSFHQSQKMVLRITHSSYLYRSRKNDRMQQVDIHEGFILAPLTVKEAIVQSILKGSSHVINKQIKSYTHHPDYREIVAQLNATEEKNSISSKGLFHDLQDIYEELNKRYFQNQLQQPRLVWSAKNAFRRLGSYDAESGTITISRRLDQADVERLLVAYVLYHEMLHQHLGIRVVNGRRHAHTSHFKAAEKKYRHLEQAQVLIRKLK